MIWDRLIGKAMTSSTVYAQFREVITPDMFKDRLLATLWTQLGGFYQEYGRAPAQTEMLVWLRRLPPHQKERVAEYIHKVENYYSQPSDIGDDVLAGEVTEAIKQDLTEKLILAGSAMLDSGQVNYDELESQMKGIIGTTTDLDLGIDIGRDPAAAYDLAINQERFTPIPTGIEGLNKTLNGGWYKKQFVCGIGSSGIGKSTFLVNHACAAAYAGFNTLLLTVELDDVMVVERILQRITQRTREELLEQRDESIGWISRWFGRADARLVVKQARSGRFTVSDLEAYLDRLEMLEGFVPDLIVVDYLDELRPSAEQRRQDKRHQHRGIAQDLVGLAKVRDVAVVTMTQTNREALEKKKVTLKHIGEDYGKVQVADLVFAICQTQDEYDKQQARIRWLKKRDRGGKGQEVPIWVDYGIMMVESLDKRIVRAA